MISATEASQKFGRKLERSRNCVDVTIFTHFELHHGLSMILATVCYEDTRFPKELQQKPHLGTYQQNSVKQKFKVVAT